MVASAIDVCLGSILFSILASGIEANATDAGATAAVSILETFLAGNTAGALAATAVNIGLTDVQPAVLAGVAIAFAIETIAETAVTVCQADFAFSTWPTSTAAIDVRFVSVEFAVGASLSLIRVVGGSRAAEERCED